MEKEDESRYAGDGKEIEKELGIQNESHMVKCRLIEMGYITHLSCGSRRAAPVHWLQHLREETLHFMWAAQ